MNASDSISFEEFLQGIASFIKAPYETKIKTLFSLYDLDNNGFIELEEFQKMLYNYPQDDIEIISAIFQGVTKNH